VNILLILGGILVFLLLLRRFAGRERDKAIDKAIAAADGEKQTSKKKRLEANKEVQEYLEKWKRESEAFWESHKIKL